MKSYSLLDTLPLNKHTHIKQDSISTMFTDNGNIVYGDELFDLARHLWEVKDQYHANFQINLYEYFELFIKGFALRRAVKYYSNHFSWGLFNPDRPDSLFSYALVLKRSMKTSPLVPSSSNWSNQDLRGKNVTTVPENRSALCKCDVKSFWSRPVCPCCEKQGTSERVELSLLPSLKNSTCYRLSKLLNP